MAQSEEMKLDELPSILGPLGFTETEALVYGELLRQPDQTGYGLSKSINKGQPITYAALSGLESKGAVLVGIGAAKAYRATPPAELLAVLRDKFERRCAAAQEKLAKASDSAASEDLFQLRSLDQVLERARVMTKGATATVLFEMLPAFDTLRSSFVEAALRPDVDVVGLVFRPEDHIDGARTVMPARAAEILKLWKQDVLIIIVDARQVLIASLDADGQLSRAIWTDSVFFSVLFHNAIAADILLHEAKGHDWRGANHALVDR